MIPLWNHQGLIPPNDDSNPTSAERSPYYTTVDQIIERFATSLERCEILDGYLAHRRELHRMGVCSGFQWLDGSFTEHVELIEGRAPNDIDVVTFLSMDDVWAESLNEPDLRTLGVGSKENHKWVKETYKVDHYIQSLLDRPEYLVYMSSYWYSMWSHRRTKQWKGFLHVYMDADHDDNAQRILNIRRQEINDEKN